MLISTGRLREKEIPDRETGMVFNVKTTTTTTTTTTGADFFPGVLRPAIFYKPCLRHKNRPQRGGLLTEKTEGTGPAS